MTPKPAKENTTPTSDNKATATTDTKLIPKNADQVKQAIALGKDMLKEMASNPDITKANIARAMYPLIQDESREVIAAAFIEGAGLTEKGAMTYYYNTKRQAAKAKPATDASA
jgi:hypothetical protein